MSLFLKKDISLYNPIKFLAILYPTWLANMVVEVGTRHSHQILLLWCKLIPLSQITRITRERRRSITTTTRSLTRFWAQFTTSTIWWVSTFIITLGDLVVFNLQVQVPHIYQTWNWSSLCLLMPWHLMVLGLQLTQWWIQNETCTFQIFMVINDFVYFFPFFNW